MRTITLLRHFGMGLALLALPVAPTFSSGGHDAVERHYTTMPDAPASQSKEQMVAKSEGCQTCHTSTDEKTMHINPAVKLGCTDCHGGDADVNKPSGSSQGDHNYLDALEYTGLLTQFKAKWLTDGAWVDELP